MNASPQPVILIVDPSPDHLSHLSSLLQEHYVVRTASHADAAIQQAQQLPRPELILLDVQLDGYALGQQLRANPDTAAIAIIFVLDQGQQDLEQRGFCEGGAEVLVRPLVAETLLARVAGQLQLRQLRRQLQQQDERLDYLVAERTEALTRMVDAGIWALATLADTRNMQTQNHLCRVQQYVAALARQLQPHARFAHELAEANIPLLAKAAPLHDIGKVRIPDAILLKPGRLTPEEFATMKLHTVYGRDAIAGIEQRLGTSNTFLRFAREIAYSHQEKFDGSGYPQGLAGDAIPVAARLMAVADVYDALISKRVYKPAFTHETAIELIRQGSGEHFDPDVVDAMLTVEEEFMAIAAHYQDATD